MKVYQIKVLEGKNVVSLPPKEDKEEAIKLANTLHGDKIWIDVYKRVDTISIYNPNFNKSQDY